MLTRKAPWLLTTMLMIVFFAANAWSVNGMRVNVKNSKRLHLIIGKSLTLDFDSPVERASTGDPTIADINILSPTEIHVVGKKIGITNLTIWQENETHTYDVEVAHDVSRLKRRLHDILPKEKEIKIYASPNSITLSGNVSSARKASEAVALTESFIPAGTKVVNLLNVNGVHQVMLKVKVAEVSKLARERLGINFTWSQLGDFVFGLSGANTLLSSLVGPAFSITSGDTTIEGLLGVLKENNLIKILAEPTLLAISGQKAEFLAGGEFAVPIKGKDGEVTIEYRKFGIQLDFTPVVLDENRISIRVEPTISELDWSLGTTSAGTSVPGLKIRQVSTTVELKDGQTFAIAGLLKNSTFENISKIPGLGDLPILGALFKSKEFQKEETELLILVTPYLARPLPPNQPLPTDYYVEPDDAEFFIWGIFGKSMETNGKNPIVLKGELDGEFGLMVVQ